MKTLLASIAIVASLAGCTTAEQLDINGKVTSRTRTPSPETWTIISNAVANAGAQAVKAWADQMADQQRWERGQK